MTIAVILVIVAGFLLGGVYSFWTGGKRLAAAVVGVAAVLALVGAWTWWRSDT